MDVSSPHPPLPPPAGDAGRMHTLEALHNAGQLSDTEYQSALRLERDVVVQPGPFEVHSSPAVARTHSALAELIEQAESEPVGRRGLLAAVTACAGIAIIVGSKLAWLSVTGSAPDGSRPDSHLPEQSMSLVAGVLLAVIGAVLVVRPLRILRRVGTFAALGALTISWGRIEQLWRRHDLAATSGMHIGLGVGLWLVACAAAVAVAVVSRSALDR